MFSLPAMVCRCVFEGPVTLTLSRRLSRCAVGGAGLLLRDKEDE